MDAVVRGGTVVTATAIEVMDVGIRDGKVASIGQELPRAKLTIDATGCLVLPGAIDAHTHLHHWSEDVGSYNADDYESGTRAAAAGGITTIIDYAFSEPEGSLRDALERDMAAATSSVHIDFGLHPVLTAATDDTLSEMALLSGQGFPSVKVFTAILPLPESDLLRVLAVGAENRILVNVHAEDAPLIDYLTAEQRRRGNTDVRYLPLSRPPVAEAIASHRVATYAAHLGCPVYFVHVSSAAALDVLERVRAQGAEIYIETRPAYLFLDGTRYELPEREGNRYVCLPPLRSMSDREALWDGLQRGAVQTYATDHSPWMAAQKLDPAREFWRIPPGFANLQTSIPMLFSEGVVKDRITLRQFVELTSTNPAKLFGLYPRKGTIAVGSDADLLVLDPKQSFRLSAGMMQSRSDYEPFEDMEGQGQARYVLSRGDVIVEGNNILSRPGRGRFLARKRIARGALTSSVSA